MTWDETNHLVSSRHRLALRLLVVGGQCVDHLLEGIDGKDLQQAQDEQFVLAGFDFSDTNGHGIGGVRFALSNIF